MGRGGGRRGGGRGGVAVESGVEAKTGKEGREGGKAGVHLEGEE